jgi:hypothetical protein
LHRSGGEEKRFKLTTCRVMLAEDDPEFQIPAAGGLLPAVCLAYLMPAKTSLKLESYYEWTRNTRNTPKNADQSLASFGFTRVFRSNCDTQEPDPIVKCSHCQNTDIEVDVSRC